MSIMFDIRFPLFYVITHFIFFSFADYIVRFCYEVLALPQSMSEYIRSPLIRLMYEKLDHQNKHSNSNHDHVVMFNYFHNILFMIFSILSM